MRLCRFRIRRIIFAHNIEIQIYIYMKKVCLFAFAFLVAASAFAQLNPVKWSYEALKTGDGEYDLVFKAHITDGWYVYSQNLESDEGPIPTSFTFQENALVQMVGKTVEAGPKHEGYDDIFEMNVIKYSGQPTFTQHVRIKSPTVLTGSVEYMTCDKNRCLPPVNIDFTFTLQ